MKRMIAMLVLLGLVGLTNASAATRWFNHFVPSGDDLWSNTNNWNHYQMPFPSGEDDVMLYPNGGTGGLCQMDTNGVTVVGINFAGDSPVELEITPTGSLAWTNQAWAGFGMVAGQTNILTMNGGSLEVDTAGTWFVFGDNGVGTLNMNDGLLKTGNLRIDFDKSGASGQANMTGGTIELAGYLRIGTRGVFHMTGGEVVVRDKDDRAVMNSYITSGQITGGATSSYDGTNTYLNVVPTVRWFNHLGATGNDLWSDSGNWQLGGPSLSGLDSVNLYPQGGDPAGGLCQVDTTAIISNVVVVGIAGAVVELEILSAGDLTLAPQALWPNFGTRAGKTDILTINGGSLDVQSTNWLAFGNAGTGILNMNSGLLEASNLRIDWDAGGSGQAYMTGGTIDLSGYLRIGTGGLLNMTGGQIISRDKDDTVMLQWAIDQGLITGGPTLSYDGTNTYLYHSEVFSYATWVEDYNLTGTNALYTTDIEPDGMDNLLEYALGGNPTNDDAAAILPTSEFTASSIEYVFRRRRDAVGRGLDYDVVLNTNGLQSAWDNVGSAYETSSGVIDDDFESVTNTIPTTGIDIGFVNLEVTEN